MTIIIDIDIDIVRNIPPIVHSRYVFRTVIFRIVFLLDSCKYRKRF